MVAFFVPMPHYVVPTTMIDVIKHLGLQSSLQLCLDAGDSASYGSSSQTWADVSGNNHSFYRGGTSGAESRDPAFAGTAGRQSSEEYFSSDGGDAFWQTGSHTFANNWHKDNAQFTLAGWFWMPSGQATPPGYIILGNTKAASTDPGFSIQFGSLSSTGRMSFNYRNGSIAQALLPSTQDVVVENAWMFGCLSLSEGSGTTFVRVNGTTEVIANDTFSSPSAANPTAGLAIWALPDASGNPFAGGTEINGSGARINSLIAWNRALTQSEVTALYDATKTKFGL